MSSTTQQQSPTTSEGGGGNSEMDEIASLECPICLQPCIHPVELPCTHIFCFLCIKGVAMQGQSRCAICRASIPHSVLTHPRLKDVSQLYKHTKADHEWFYEARGGGWWQYDERSMQELDRAYETGSTSCQLLIAGHLYEIDFSQMLQYRSNNRNLSRRIKRDVASSEKRGVAGIRLGTGGGGTEGGDANSNNRSNRGRRTAPPTSIAGNSSLSNPSSSTPTTGSSVVDVGLELPPSRGSNSSAPDDDGDEGVDSDDPDYSGEEEDDEMELGDEEELEESEPSEEEVELRDGARAPTRRSDRSTSSNNQTPPPGSGGSGRTSSSAAVKSCGSSSSPSIPQHNGRSSTGRGRRSHGRRGGSSNTTSGGNTQSAGTQLVASVARSETSSSASTSPSPLGDSSGGIRALGGASIRLSPAPSSQPLIEEGYQAPTIANTSTPAATNLSGSSITTTSGITCLLIGPGVRITVDREEQQTVPEFVEEIL